MLLRLVDKHIIIIIIIIIIVLVSILSCILMTILLLKPKFCIHNIFRT
jgi:hypothetical protein